MLPPFKLEDFFVKYEFSAPYLLCASDAQNWSLKEILEMADKESKDLWDHLHLGYTEVYGHPLLRKEIAHLYTSIDPNHILTTAGGEEGIFCTINALIKPKDHVIVITPCYQSLETLAHNAQADITHIALSEKNKWQLEKSDVVKAFRPHTKLVVLNYPHNPTGSLLKKDVLDTIIEMARKSGSYIFSDEMYRFMEIDEKDRLPSIADAYEKGISLFAMTKPFGLAGLRIAWLASKDAYFLKQAAAFKVYTSISNSGPSEILAIMALKSKDLILARNRNIMLNNLEVLDNFFERNARHVSWVRPQSGTIALAKLNHSMPIDQFTQLIVEKTGILILPGTIFNLSGNYFRIGFGRKNMPEILMRFEQFIQTLF